MGIPLSSWPWSLINRWRKMNKICHDNQRYRIPTNSMLVDGVKYEDSIFTKIKIVLNKHSKLQYQHREPFILIAIFWPRLFWRSIIFTPCHFDAGRLCTRSLCHPFILASCYFDEGRFETVASALIFCRQ